MIESLSQSMINMWSRCPEQFRRRYIEDDIIPPGLAAKIGTGLHEGARVNHVAKRVSRKDEPLSVVQDAARDGYVKSLQDGVFFPPDEVPSARKQMAEGVDVTVNLAKLYLESLAPLVQPEIVEERLFLEVEGLSLPFAGTIDVLTEDRWWLDIKTAAKNWPEGKEDKEIQATLYAELIARKTGSYPDKLSFEIFTNTKKLAHHSRETTRTAGDFVALVRRADLMMRSIRVGIFHPADPCSWMCSEKWCGYWASCPHISTRLKRRK